MREASSYRAQRRNSAKPLPKEKGRSRQWNIPLLAGDSWMKPFPTTKQNSEYDFSPFVTYVEPPPFRENARDRSKDVLLLDGEPAVLVSDD